MRVIPVDYYYFPGRAAERVGGAWGAREGRVGPKSDLPRTLPGPSEEQAVLHFGTHPQAVNPGRPGRGWGCALASGQWPSLPMGGTGLHPQPCCRLARAPGRRAPRDLPRGPPPPPFPGPAPVTSQTPLSGRSASSAFAHWLARQTAPLPPRPRSPGERCWGGRGPEGRGEQAPRA